MKVSICKLRNVIDELGNAEVAYKKQIYAFDKILHGYQPLDKDGKDKRTMRRIEEELQEECRQIHDLRNTLREVIRCYEATEKNIIEYSTKTLRSSSELKKLDIGDVQQILQRYNITFM